MFIGEEFEVALDVEVDACYSAEWSFLEGHPCGVECVAFAGQMVDSDGGIAGLSVLLL